MKRDNKYIDCNGTRYHLVVISDSTTILLIANVSTPLTDNELESFISSRIGYKNHNILINEVSKEKSEASNIKIAGLATFEAMLMPLVPEVVLDEKTIKYTLTNKGMKAEEVTEKGE